MKKILFVLCATLVAGTGFSQTQKLSMEADANLSSNPELHVATGHQGRVNSIAWSKDGKWLASAGVDGTVRIWNAESGKEVKKLSDFDIPRCISWHPDGKTLAVFTETDIFVLDVYSEGFIKKINLSEDYTDGEFNADGTKLLVKNNGVHIYSTRDYSEINFIPRNSKKISFAYWAPNGKYIATLEEDNFVRVYDISKSSPVLISSWKSSYIDGICWSGDSKYIVSDNAIHDAFTGKQILKTEENSGWGCSWSPDSKYIAIRSNCVLDYSELAVYDAKTGKKMYSHENSGNALGVENWSPDGTYLAIAGSNDDCYFEIIESKTGKKKIDLGINRPYLNEGALFKDETHFVTVDTGKMIGNRNGSIAIWDTSTFSRKFTVDCAERSGCAVSPDGKTLVFESVDKKLQFFDMQKQSVIKTLSKEYDTYDWVVPQWSTDEKFIIVRAYPNLEIYSATTKSLVKTFEGYHSAFSPDGTYFATDHKGAVQIWNTKNWTMHKEIALPQNEEGKTDSVYSLEWNPEGTQIAVSTESKLLLLNTQTWAFKNTAFNESEYIVTIAWTPDGKQLITNSNYYGKILVWDAKSGKLCRTIDTNILQEMSSLSLTKDGKKLISTTSNGVIQVWKFETGELLTTTIISMDGEWVTYTEEGYFVGSPWAAENFLYAVDDMKAYPLESMYETFCRTDLIAMKLRGEKITAEQIPSLKQLLSTGNAPLVQFTNPPASSNNRDITVNFSVQDAGGGVGSVYLKINGKVIQLADGSRKLELVGGVANTTQKSSGKTTNFSHLLTLQNGENTLEAYATNAAGKIESRHAVAKISWQGTTAKPNLYVLAVGVNKYRDKSLWLNYAVPDATSIADQFRSVKGNLYQSVNVATVFDGDVTADGISSAFNSLAGKVGADDVFIFYLSGHGTTHTDGDYYFIPVDFRFRNAESVPETAISKHFITEQLSKIRAQKTLVMLDTCNSGAFISTGARGMTEKTAIDRLSRATGQATIAASSDSQSAMEGYNGHGIFTFVILEGLSGKADTNNDGYVSLSELSSYAEEKVPDYSYEKWGYEQYPQVDLRKQSNFPLVGRFAEFTPEDFTSYNEDSWYTVRIDDSDTNLHITSNHNVAEPKTDYLNSHVNSPSVKKRTPTPEVASFLSAADKAYQNGDYKSALKDYKKAAKKKDPHAQSVLGDMYYFGQGVNKNNTTAAGYYKKAAAAGDVSAQANIGFMYESGTGVGKDEVKAFQWYELAASEGNAMAQNNLALMLVSMGKYDRAFELFNLAAEDGEPVAQNNLAVMYETGRGTSKDFGKAFSLYEKSAAQGNLMAQTNLAMMYENGRGTAKNLSKAISLYEKSAAAGDSVAQNNLAVLCESGLGTRRDHARALELCEKSAKAGNAYAKINLEILQAKAKSRVSGYVKTASWQSTGMFDRMAR